MEIEYTDETLGQIVSKNFRKAEVFKNHGIDFCCGGKKTLKQACAEKGLDLTKIQQELQTAGKSPGSRQLPYEDWTLDFLADYIVNTHHSYVKQALPDLRQYATKVARVHGGEHPELRRIAGLVEEINDELSSHLVKEEMVLFPYIKTLVAATNNSSAIQGSHFNTVQDPISMMEMEHELAGKKLQEIRAISNDYSLPGDACTTYTLLYESLDDFEQDLYTHVHLENNILFPKALKLEEKLKA
jgi:regulator of cell morphogenesis and NO signaling